MNRKARRAMQVEQHAYIKEQKLSDILTPLPSEEYPHTPLKHAPVMIWRSSKYLVQMFEEYTFEHPELKRLSICRATLGKAGRWQDGLTWDELQEIKRQCGYGAWYAVEVYPSDKDIVNVANMRHLWIMPTPLGIGWTK